MVEFDVYEKDGNIEIHLEDFTIIRIKAFADFGLNIIWEVDKNYNRRAIGNIPESKWEHIEIKDI